MSTPKKSKLLCFSVLAITCFVPAQAQIISTIVGNGISGRNATAISAHSPVAVAIDASGNLYAAIYEQVYKVSTAGIVTLIAGNGNTGYFGDGGAAINAELNNVRALAIDSSGNVYIADEENSVVRKVDASTGKISTVAGNGAWGYSGDGGPATTAQLSGPRGVAVDSLGDIYIGDEGNSAIRKVDASTGNISTIAGAAAGLVGPRGLALDSAGNLYIADTSGGVIRKMDASTGKVSTIAGNGTYGYSGDGGSATSAQLMWPTSVAVRAGNIYIADPEAYAIRKVVSATGKISTVAGNGIEGYSGDGAAATGAELDYPEGVAADDAGNFYIADRDNYRIRKVDASTGNISSAAGNGFYSYSGDGGPAMSAQMDYPSGLAMDNSGALYVSDAGNSVIRRVDRFTGNISTVAGNGTYGYSGDGGPATSAKLSWTNGVAVDSSGNLYIADEENSVVRKVDASTGNISTVAGNGESGSSGDGGPATNASLMSPPAVALDHFGNLYIADAGNYVIRKVDASTGDISTVAGSGRYEYSGDGGRATSAGFMWPEGLTLDSSGNLYIADSESAVIREVILDPADGANYGMIKTVAGGGTSTDPTTALGITFERPSGVYVDYAGVIFIADGTRVYKVSGSSFAAPEKGVVAVVAGNGDDGFSGDGGPAVAARLSDSDSLTGDLNGNLLIADSGNFRIRSVTGLVTTAPESVLAPTALTFDQQVLGQGSTQTKTITVSNPGTNKLTVSSVEITGANSADFTETDNCTGVSVSPKSNCAIDVKFAAKIVGDESALLTITSSALASPQTVVLSGSGVAAAPESTLSAATLAFDTQLLNSSASSTKVITITNSGNAALTVSSMTIAGTNAADFTQTNTCTSAAVASSSTCMVSVVFKATVAGSESATLTLASNAAASPQIVSLVGAGITFTAPGPPQGGSTSATVAAGGTASYSMQIAASGGATSNDSLTFSLTCSGAPTAGTCTVPGSVVAKPGNPATFTVSVATTSRTTASLGDEFLQKGMEVALIPFVLILMEIGRKRRILIGLVGLLVLSSSVIACGGGSKKTTTGTPAGSYSLTVKATSGSISQSTTLTLVVQ